MDGDEEAVGVVVGHRLRSVPRVHVPVQDQHPLLPELLTGRLKFPVANC